jgi:D-sedoheptulose 7-phosphate isomerase
LDYIQEIQNYISLEIEVLKRLDYKKISDALNVLTDALKNERVIYIFGNGGSAATASHYQNDFNKGISEYTEKKFCFYCLSDNVATITAIANDISYDEIYRQQLKGRLSKNDIVIAISGSGNSKNVINAVDYAKSVGTYVIGLTGYNGGILGKLADLHLHADINSMQITEDIHMILDHLMMSILYKTLCGKEHLKN